jgi:hypothetical protein
MLLGGGVVALMCIALWTPADQAAQAAATMRRQRAGPVLAEHIRGLASTASLRAAWIAPAAVLLVALAFIVYMTVRVPVDISMLPGGERGQYWPAAAAAAVLVAAIDVTLVRLAMARSRRKPAFVAPSRTQEGAGRLGAIPRELQFQRVPGAVVVATALASGAALAASLAMTMPLWFAALAALVPWLPACCWEASWKQREYGLYALLLVVAVLQAGHVGEHSAQVTQLLATDGDLSRSHGVFGQLDFETVHFFWDTAIWVILGLLAYTFPRNGWLWLAFGAASLHEMEHMYLYWLFLAQPDFYMRGGLSGIMGRGGVIGSPLYRPYLHFLYNVLVLAPLLAGLLLQTRDVMRTEGAAPRRHVDRWRPRSSPGTRALDDARRP